MADGPNLIAINVGNTRTHVGKFVDGELVEHVRCANRDAPSILQTVLGWWESIAELPAVAIALASVVDQVAESLTSMIQDQLSIDVYRVGEDLPIPIGMQLDPETITGVDRLLNAAAAYDGLKEACVVVDAGTAITVDFVDGEGTFHGGAIAPGAQMQLHALHEYTAALPELDFSRPDDDAFGRSTAQAMLKGVYHGIRGMVWRLVEQYAQRYGAYPQVIATGGDAETLFADDELVDRIVPHLTLRGIRAAAGHALAVQPDDDSSPADQ